MANGTLAASQIEMLSQSGTGIITITPPATNTNRAITLPDAAGAIVVSGTTPSLNGIAFPATQVASAGANTLDDYEEGTWTPVVAGGSTAGTGTYTLQEGTYTKIGNMVIANCGVTYTAHTGTGDLTITGLPFTASSAITQAGSVFANDFNAGALATQVFAFPSGSSNTILFRGFVNNATRTVPAVDTAAQLGVTLTYRI